MDRMKEMMKQQDEMHDKATQSGGGGTGEVAPHHPAGCREEKECRSTERKG